MNILLILLGIVVYLVMCLATYVMIGLIQGKDATVYQEISRDFAAFFWPVGIPISLLYVIFGIGAALIIMGTDKLLKVGDYLIKKIRGE